MISITILSAIAGSVLLSMTEMIPEWAYIIVSVLYAIGCAVAHVMWRDHRNKVKKLEAQVDDLTKEVNRLHTHVEMLDHLKLN